MSARRLIRKRAALYNLHKNENVAIWPRRLAAAAMKSAERAHARRPSKIRSRGSRAE